MTNEALPVRAQVLAGQVAVVTGAGSGIGRAVAVALAAHGARVALAGRRAQLLDETAAAIGAAGGTALAVVVDITDPVEVDALFDAVEKAWGRVDLLFNNAGINTTRRNFANLPVADWHRVIDTNLSGAFFCTRRALVAMRRQGAGTIVNLVSTAAKRAGAGSGVAYGASKAGMASLTQSILAEEAAYNIRACSIFPGAVNTPLMDRRATPPDAAARAAMLQPEDVAAAVVLVAALPARALIEEIVIRPR